MHILCEDETSVSRWWFSSFFCLNIFLILDGVQWPFVLDYVTLVSSSVRYILMKLHQKNMVFA